MDLALLQEVAARIGQSDHLTLHLRKLKRQLIGHRLVKISYIHHGLIENLGQIVRELENYAASPRTEPIWLQVSAIVSCLAQEGPAFTTPILEGKIHTGLIAAFKHDCTARVRLSILRTLIVLADNLPCASNHGWDIDPTLAHEFYIENVARILAQACAYDGQSLIEQQLCCASMRIIRRLRRSSMQGRILLKAGLIEVLARRLLNHIHTEDASLLDHERHAQCNRNVGRAPTLTPLLSTICAVLHDSTAGIDAFLNYISAHDITQPYAERSAGPFDQRHRQSISLTTAGTTSQIPNSFSSLLPDAADPDLVKVARRSGFPLLSASSRGHQKRRTQSMRATVERSTLVLDETQDQLAQESLLIPWLLYQIRTKRRSTRVAAVSLLAELQNHGSISTARSRSFASLLIPTVVDLLASGRRLQSETSQVDLESATDDECSTVSTSLASFVKDNPLLVRVSVDIDAIPRLVHLLKVNLEESTDLETSLWWPDKTTPRTTDEAGVRQLGPGGPTVRMRRAMRTRQGLLQALAVLSAEDDEYKRDVCDKGALSPMLSSLAPFEAVLEARTYGKTMKIEGNSAETLIAACNAIRALTRSPTALRTKIVDTDVTKAIIKLLNVNEPAVRVAATMVLANLAHDFSPMKSGLADGIVLRKLCDHVHSANAHLRRESLFALKAMVYEAPIDLKRQVVEFLGADWIRQLVSTDPHDVPPGIVIGLQPRDYEKDSLARLREVADEMELDKATGESEIATEDFNSHSLSQDLEIQAELLALIRNLTTGQDAESIINHLMEEIGQVDFMQMLVDRLRSYSVGRRTSSKIHSLPATLEHTLYILVHMAAANRKYRNMIVDDTMLVRYYSELFDHSQPSIRLACLWLTLNLIYPQAEPFDQAQRRGQELLKHGAKLHAIRIMQNDAVMDLKERAVTVVDCFQRLML